MVTLNKMQGRVTRGMIDLFGLSTDEKPIDSYDGIKLSNGSTFTEVDSGTKFVFDEENHAWYEVPTGGGGGGSGPVVSDELKFVIDNYLVTPYIDGEDKLYFETGGTIYVL